MAECRLQFRCCILPATHIDDDAHATRLEFQCRSRHASRTGAAQGAVGNAGMARRRRIDRRDQPSRPRVHGSRRGRRSWRCARCCRCPTITRCSSPQGGATTHAGVDPAELRRAGAAGRLRADRPLGQDRAEAGQAVRGHACVGDERGRQLPRRSPRASTWQFAADSAYVHITANETIHGVEFRDIPDTGDIPLVADFSSSIASEPLDVSKFGDHLRRRAEEPRAGRHQRGDRAPRPARTRRPAARRHLRLSLAAQGRVDAQHAADLELVHARPQRASGCWTRAAWPSSRNATHARRNCCTRRSTGPAASTATKSSRRCVRA